MVQPYHLLTINYFRDPDYVEEAMVYVLNSENQEIAISPTYSNPMLNQSSNLPVAQVIEFLDTNSFSSRIIVADSAQAYSKTSIKAGAYPLYYHNWSNEIKPVYIVSKGAHIQIRHNRSVNNLKWECYRGIEYRYHSSHIWHYPVNTGGSGDLAQNQQYRIFVEGGNSVIPSGFLPGLTYSLTYHINGVDQGYITMYDDITNAPYTHRNQSSDTYISTTIKFTTPYNATGIYLKVAAALRYSNDDVYTGLQYRFKIDY